MSEGWTLENILNWVIPIGIVIFFFFIFYSKPKIKDAVNSAAEKIRDLIVGIRNKFVEMMYGPTQEVQEIIYD